MYSYRYCKPARGKVQLAEVVNAPESVILFPGSLELHNYAIIVPVLSNNCKQV